MTGKQVITGKLMDESTVISFVEVCEQCHISEEDLMKWLDHGLFSDVQSSQRAQFNQTMVLRIKSARRLHHDLGINLQGVVLALELLDELKTMQQQLTILKRLR